MSEPEVIYGNPRRDKEKPRRQTDYFWRILAVVALIAFCVIGCLNALKGRYHTFRGGSGVIDSWTGKVYQTEDMIVIQPEDKINDLE